MNKDITYKTKVDNNFSVELLDTLAQTRQGSSSAGFIVTKKEYEKRASAKYRNNSFILKYVDLNTSLTQAYWNTYHCSENLEQIGQKVHSKYCKNKWCKVCARIYTAKAINQYLPVLSEMKEPYFVTLTIPNVKDFELLDVRDKMLRFMRTVVNTKHRNELKRRWKVLTNGLPIKNNDQVRKRFMKLNGFKGIRKFECTINPVLNNYHPHLHIVIDGLKAAEYLRTEWLNEFPTAKLKVQSAKGEIYLQDIRPADTNNLKELFKYFSKDIKNDRFVPEMNHVVNLISRGCRVLQPFGIKAKIEENIEDLEIQKVIDLENDVRSWFWNDKMNDWVTEKVDIDTGEIITEKFTGYKPSKKDIEIREIYGRSIEQKVTSYDYSELNGQLSGIYEKVANNNAKMTVRVDKNKRIGKELNRVKKLYIKTNPFALVKQTKMYFSEQVNLFDIPETIKKKKKRRKKKISINEVNRIINFKKVNK